MKVVAWIRELEVGKQAFLGISVLAWLVFVATTLIVFVALRWIRSALLARLEALAARNGTTLDALGVGLVERTTSTFLLMLSLYIGASMLPLTPRQESTAWMVMLVAGLIQSGLWAHEVIDYALKELVHRRANEDSGLRTAAGAVAFAARIVVWSVLFILILSNLHVDVTTLIAGLGIGGIAVALALQNILGDLFASLSILVDQPFVVGHFVVIGDMAGTVEYVGLKTTRIRALSGEQVIFSNTELLKSRIHNYKRLFERRVLLTLGVTYDTQYEQLKAIPSMVREIVEHVDKTRFDRANFRDFGESALNFEVVYFVLGPNYNLYMDIQEKINLGIYQGFKQRGIEFAFPTRTMLVSSPEVQALPEHHNGDAARNTAASSKSI